MTASHAASRLLLQRQAHGLDDLARGDVTVLLDHVVCEPFHFGACIDVRRVAHKWSCSSAVAEHLGQLYQHGNHKRRRRAFRDLARDIGERCSTYLEEAC